MNRKILIPILLSTFLLVGCESELDRCIEANSARKNFSEGLLYVSLHIQKGMDYTYFACMRESPSRLEDIPFKAYKMVFLDRDDNIQQEVMYTPEDVDFCNAKAKEAYKPRAIRICNTQGIY